MAVAVELQARVRDYCVKIGLELMFDEAEGDACLRQRPQVDGEAELPRLAAYDAHAAEETP